MVDIEELAKLLLGMAAVGNAAAAIIKALDHWRERRRRRHDPPSSDAQRLHEHASKIPEETTDDLGIGA